MNNHLKPIPIITRLSQLLILLSLSFSYSQNNLTSINQDSFDNFTNSYNYTYWNNNWKSSISEDRSFTNYTSTYSLNINYDKLSINSLLINDQELTKTAGFAQLNSAIFPSNYTGNIDYAILQNGAVVYDKSTTPTNSGAKDSQMAEYGVWCNRRFISTNFNGTPPINKYHTGIYSTDYKS